MDAEEKRRKKAEYQREYRKKLKENAISIVKPDLEVNLDNTPALTHRPKKAKPVPLKENTIKTYVSKLRAFHKRMTELDISVDIINAIKGEPYDKDAVRVEFNYIYKNMEHIKKNEINAIPNLVKVFSKVVGFVKLVKILTPLKWKIEEGLEIRRNETTIKETDLISFEKQEVLQNAISKLDNDTDKIIYLLMMLLPTRRLSDYRDLIIGKFDDETGNYYEDGYLYINEANTKNKKSIKIKIPNEIIDFIPEQGQLLGYKREQSALSRRFSEIMFKIYGKRINALDLRRMYLTNINKSGASFSERKEIADAVGNSVEESIRYSMKTI